MTTLINAVRLIIIIFFIFLFFVNVENNCLYSFKKTNQKSLLFFLSELLLLLLQLSLLHYIVLKLALCFCWNAFFWFLGLSYSNDITYSNFMPTEPEQELNKSVKFLPPFDNIHKGLLLLPFFIVHPILTPFIFPLIHSSLLSPLFRCVVIITVFLFFIFRLVFFSLSAEQFCCLNNNRL